MSDLPQGWEWATLGDLAAPEERAITDGPFGSNLKSAHYTPYGARVLRLQNIGDGVFRDERAYIDLDHFARLRAHEAREGDLLVASLGDAPPRACLVPRIAEPAIVKADCIRVRLSSLVDAHWVLYTLISPATKAAAAAAITGVGRPRLGLQHIRNLSVPIPPLVEQRRIVADLESYFSRLEKGLSLLSKAESTADPKLIPKVGQLRLSLLAEAFAGRLVPQDPNDEPASVLLDRIRAERNAQPKTRRTRRTTAP